MECFTTSELVKELLNRKLITREMALDNSVNRIKMNDELDGDEIVWDNSLTDEDLSLIFPIPNLEEKKENEQLKRLVSQLQDEIRDCKNDLEKFSKVEEVNVVLRQRVLNLKEKTGKLEHQLAQLMVKGSEFCVGREELLEELLEDKFVLKCEEAEQAMTRLDNAIAEYNKVFMDGFLINQVFQIIMREERCKGVRVCQGISELWKQAKGVRVV